MKKYKSKITETRDHYVDFLRAFGLLLLIVAHTAPPLWLKSIRTFDVPLMVMVSAMCYKPLRGGVVTYLVKRFKRIYIPVVLFLCIFFCLAGISHYVIGYPYLGMNNIIGSFLLLNYPSIGYVWVMRVFLLMALLMPLFYRFINRANYWLFLFIILGIVALQHYLILGTEMVDNRYINFGIEQIVLYASGYSAIAIFGLRIMNLKRLHLYVSMLVVGGAVIVFLVLNDWLFDPQSFKYPPQSLYILYGIFMGGLLWVLKPLLENIVGFKIFGYLSKNSMWIYLWHIIPLYAFGKYMEVLNIWFVRYVIVLATALLLTWIYNVIISKFPEKIRILIK